MDYSRRSGESVRQRPATYEGARTLSSSRRSGASSRNNTTGYPVRKHNIRFNDRPSPRGFFARYDSRGLILIAVAILVAFLLIFGIVGCVRSCVQNNDEARRSSELNQIDERVAAGATDEITRLLSPALNDAEKVETLAKSADAYTDATLIELALAEPAAFDFVLAYPEAEKEASAYTGSLEEGERPLLYNWDSRWGNVDYAGHPLAVTGSGPSVMSMAYMALTGKTDKTPADMANLAAEKGWDTGDLYTSSELFTSGAGDVGLLCNQIDLTEDRLVGAFNGGNLIIAQVNGGTLTANPHYVLISRINDNGSLEVHDPTSSDVSTREWDAATIVSSSQAIFAIAENPEASSTSESE